MAATRRNFLSTSALSAAAALAGTGAAQRAAADDDADLDAVDSLPNACCHEHWGSLPAFGTKDVGFVADTEAGARPTDLSVFDFVFDPYLGGFLAAGGFGHHGLAREAGHGDIMAMCRAEPGTVLVAAQPHLANQRSVGTLMCTTLGIRQLHGFDLDELSADNHEQATARLREAYDDVFGHYREAMERASFSHLIRPVELSFMYETASRRSAREELAFTLPILRIDGLVEFFRRPSSRLEYCKEKTGIEPHDAASWRQLIEQVFELARERGNVGIKQAQAYSRDLDFRPVAETDVDFAPESAEEARPLEDFIVNECCRLAHELGWPFQIHIGTANLPRSAPLPLESLARRYPRCKLVLIHTWPYLDECAWLAHFLPNVYIDTCWLPILSPSFFEAALQRYLGFVPAHKVMLSHDATSVEMACGSAQLTRGLLRKVLQEHVADGRINESQALHLARRMLHDNGCAVYGLEPAMAAGEG